VPLTPVQISVLLSFYRFQYTYESSNSLWPESSGRDVGFFCLFFPFSVKSDGVTERLEVDQPFILPIIFDCAVQQYHNTLFCIYGAVLQ